MLTLLHAGVSGHLHPSDFFIIFIPAAIVGAMLTLLLKDRP